jgi:hypothetical protein
MMGLNALSHDVPYGTLHEVARETTDDEVAQLLGSHWRPRVMGAWLASGRALLPDAVLLKSLETSAGSLTAPPLATVALDRLGIKAAPSLNTYLRKDLEHQWGSASFVAARRNAERCPSHSRGMNRVHARHCNLGSVCSPGAA